MELYQLEYFLEAARQQSFTRAAEQLYLAQAALSEQIRKLEQELGTTLFDRSRRGTTLTAAGEVLRQRAELLLEQAAATRRAVEDVVQRRSGRLVVAAIPSVSACLLPRTTAEFRALHPGVAVHLMEGTSEQVAQLVEENRAELGIVQRPTSRGVFEETLLLTEPFVVIVSREHRFARRRTVELKQLERESFVLYRGRARDAALHACRTAGFEPTILCENCELDTVRSLVSMNLAVALLPILAAQKATSECKLLTIAGETVARDIAILQRPNASLSPSGVVFLEALRQILPRVSRGKG